MAPDQTTHFCTMSNPNTNALVSMLQGTLQPKKPPASGFKIVKVGMDKLPVSILEMDSINGKTWQKMPVLIVVPTL